MRAAVLAVGVYVVATAVTMDSGWQWLVLISGAALIGVYDAMREDS